MKYNGGTTIAEVEVRVDIGNVMGLPTRVSRQQVVAGIDRGSSYVTAFQQMGKWVRGEDVRVVSVGYERFLRTDRNAVSADNLGSLPRIP
ncbi:MAG: DUF3892 domain-containing protein [Sandaracinus sp.]